MKIKDQLPEQHEHAEDLVRGVMDPFENDSEWKRGRMDEGKRGESDYSYDEMIDFLTKIILENADAIELTEEDWLHWQDLGLSEENLFYSHDDNHSQFLLYTPAFSLGKNGLVNGPFEYSIPDPSIDAEQVAEPGTLLYNIRKEERRIVEGHMTDYTEPNPTIVPGDGYIDETLFSLEIPINYDPDEIEETVDAATEITRELDNYFLAQLPGSAPKH